MKKYLSILASLLIVACSTSKEENNTQEASTSVSTEVTTVTETLDFSTPIKATKVFEPKGAEQIIDLWLLDWKALNHKELRNEGYGFSPAEAGETEVFYEAGVKISEDGMEIAGAQKIGFEGDKVSRNMLILSMPMAQFAIPFMKSCLRQAKARGIEIHPTAQGLKGQFNGIHYRASVQGNYVFLVKDTQE